MYDVIVVGAGPAGSATAKKCAQLGLKTLVLEKKTLPRDKLCSGMIMGRMSNELIQQEFGTIPESVLTSPQYLKGIKVHAPGIEPEIVEQRMPYAWRRDLDYWLVQKAKQAGAELRDQARVTSVTQKGDRCLVRLGAEVLEAKFVVGTDGAKSTVRRQICPESSLASRFSYRECYRGQFTLDREYYHWILPTSRIRPRFDVNFKGEFLLLEGALKDLKDEVARFMRPFGFSEELKPEWKDGCVSGARPTEGFLSGPLPVVKGNMLVAGDAAMLQLPLTGEGICTALKSGFIAARSIADAIGSKHAVSEVYLRQLEPLFDSLRKMLVEEKKAQEAAKVGGAAVARAFADGLRTSFTIP